MVCHKFQHHQSTRFPPVLTNLLRRFWINRWNQIMHHHDFYGASQILINTPAPPHRIPHFMEWKKNILNILYMQYASNTTIVTSKSPCHVEKVVSKACKTVITWKSSSPRGCVQSIKDWRINMAQLSSRTETQYKCETFDGARRWHCVEE